MIAIRIEDLQKNYVKRKTGEVTAAVKDLRLEIKKGEIIGLLGPNGAGKTSTIKMICGLIRPNHGEVYIFGEPVHERKSKTAKYISAVLEGNRNLYWRLSVEENLEYFAGNRGIPRKSIQDRIDQLLERFDLKDKRKELVHSLSRGMQQKLAIAVALLADTEIILLDEPTLGLDVETGYEVRKIIKEIAQEEEKTLIISSHDMPVIEDVCERVIIINKGELVTDERTENLLGLFDTKFYRLKLGEGLTDNQESRLKEKFPLAVYKPLAGGEASIEVNLQDSEEIYSLFDILKENGSPIVEIKHEENLLEQVFLNIVKGGEGHVATT